MAGARQLSGLGAKEGSFFTEEEDNEEEEDKMASLAIASLHAVRGVTLVTRAPHGKFMAAAQEQSQGLKRGQQLSTSSRMESTRRRRTSLEPLGRMRGPRVRDSAPCRRLPPPPTI